MSAAEHITALQTNGQRLRLDRRGRLVTLIGQSLTKRGDQFYFCKSLQGLLGQNVECGRDCGVTETVAKSETVWAGRAAARQHRQCGYAVGTKSRRRTERNRFCSQRIRGKQAIRGIRWRRETRAAFQSGQHNRCWAASWRRTGRVVWAVARGSNSGKRPCERKTLIWGVITPRGMFLSIPSSIPQSSQEN